MTIEKLTDEERGWFEGESRIDPGPAACVKALRIIDQLTAALEAAESQRDEARGEYARLQTSIDLMPPSALAAELKAEKQRFAAMVLEFGGLKDAAESLQARVAELEAVREATLAPEGHGGYLDLVKRANAAEAELATAKARVAELEAEVSGLSEGQSVLQDRISELSLPKDLYAVVCAPEAESELADLRGRVQRALVEWDRVKRHYQVPMHLCVALEALRGR